VASHLPPSAASLSPPNASPTDGNRKKPLKSLLGSNAKVAGVFNSSLTSFMRNGDGTPTSKTSTWRTALAMHRASINKDPDRRVCHLYRSKLSRHSKENRLVVLSIRCTEMQTSRSQMLLTRISMCHPRYRRRRRRHNSIISIRREIMACILPGMDMGSQAWQGCSIISRKSLDCCKPPFAAFDVDVVSHLSISSVEKRHSRALDHSSRDQYHRSTSADGRGSPHQHCFVQHEAKQRETSLLANDTFRFQPPNDL
jgi:hypothetical protein